MNTTRFKNFVENSFLNLCRIFKDYPVTLGCIVIFAAIYSITYYSFPAPKILSYITIFLAVYSVQALFTEEMFREKLRRRIAAYMIAVPLALFPVFLSIFSDNYLFGIKIYTISEITSDIYLVYFSFLVMSSLHHIYIRSKDKFDRFFLKTFSSVLQTSVIYGLFAGGLAIIILIFDLLLFDTGHFLGRIEIFLAGGIYAPALLLAVSDEKKEPGKFARICILYALEPMLILAMAIIYIYIIKVFVTFDVPRNTIFSIITWLFASGMVIWTLASGVDKNNIFGRIAGILPFVFIPCIILQAWSLFVRIAEHGITPSRYWCLVIIIFELIYLVLYFIQTKTQRDSMSYLFWVIPALTFISLLAPFINYASASITSQSNVFKEIAIYEDLLDTAEGNRAGSAYNVIAYECGYRGEIRAEKMFSKEEANILQKCSGSSYDWKTEVYFNESKQLEDFDISKYKRITRVHCYDKDSDKNHIILEADGKKILDADISTFVEELKKCGRQKARPGSYEPFDLDAHDLIVIDDKYDLKLISIGSTYNAGTDDFDYININGYLLEK